MPGARRRLRLGEPSKSGTSEQKYFLYMIFQGQISVWPMGKKGESDEVDGGGGTGGGGGGR